MAWITYLGQAMYIQMTNLAADGTASTSEQNPEPAIDRSYICICRPSSCELGDILGGGDQVNLEMYLEAEI